MEGSSRYSGLKLKVIIGFTLATGTLALAGWITFNSYNQLLDSVSVISEPNKQLKKISKILTDLALAESNIRTYSITKNELLLDEYALLVNYIKEDIQVLMEDDSGSFENQQLYVDSLSTLLDLKLENLKALEEFKNYSVKQDFTTKALREIEIAEDSAVSTTLAQTKTQRIQKTDTLITAVHSSEIEENTKKPKRGLFKRLKNLFSKKKNDSTELLVTRPQEEELITDSLVTIVSDTSVLKSVKQALINLQKQENYQQERHRQRELALLLSNSEIIDLMRNVIKVMEEEERKSSTARKQEAQFIVEGSLFKFALIVFICLLGCFVFIILITSDITKNTYFKKQLEKEKKRAEDLSNIKERFLANMSHEIRTPLNAILGFSNQLAQTDLNTSQSEQLQAVLQSSDHLLSIVNDILDFSKIKAGKLKIERIPFKVSDVIDDIHKTLKIKADNKDIRLSYVIGSDASSVVLGDPIRLKQVLFNLVDNAIKFTNRGEVRLVCKCTPVKNQLECRFAVKDTGVGIPKEKLDTIFGEFNQADASTNRQFGGTGLGLAISKQLVELQGGVMAVKSSLGKGSSFAVRLHYPITSEELLGHIQADYSTADHALKGRKILVIDDDRFNISLTKMILEKWGVDVTTASNAKSGLAQTERQVFDLIFSDINMPDATGVELTKQVRTSGNPNAHTPIIAFTANALRNDIETYLTAGMDDYLTKPFKEEDIFLKINQILNLEIKERNAKEKPSNTTNGKLYCTKEIKRALGSHPEVLSDILQSFIEETSENLELLEYNLPRQDWTALRNTTHKMLSAFGQFKIEAVTPILEDLHRLPSEKEDYDYVAPKIREILDNSRKVISEMEQEISSIPT